MKFPSIKILTDNFVATVKRFPFEVLFALTGTIAQTIHIEQDSSNNPIFIRLIMTANLGLLLSLVVSLYTNNKTNGKYLLIRFAVAALAASLFFIFDPQLRTIDYTRFFLLSLAFHLLVSFAAFANKGNVWGFWQFNKTLFLRFLTSILYSAVLCLGLDAALAASNFLFNLHLEYKIYFILFTWIVGMFNTIFFLAGIPADIASLETDNSYSKALKVFTQYVLIPLASVYVVILLAYEFKILVQWNLPKGLVSNLILGYGVFGILSILLVYPLREQEENKWIKIYARSFYFLLIPLIVLLFLAIYSRVLPYGVTPSRYFLIALACWLLFITLYFLFSKKQNIKIIPISLALLTLLSIYGPQSAFSISKYSQRNRLIGIFEKYKAIKNGKLSSLAKTKASLKDGKEAIEKLRYFIYDDDFKGLQPYIAKDIDKIIDSIGNSKDTIDYKRYKLKHEAYYDTYERRANEFEWVVKYLGLTEYENGELPGVVYYTYNAQSHDLLNVKGFDYVLSFPPGGFDYEKQNKKIDNINLSATSDSIGIYLTLNNEKVAFNLKNLADSLIKNEVKIEQYRANSNGGNDSRSFEMPNQLLGFSKQTKHFKVTFQIINLNITCSKNKNIESSFANGYFLLNTLK